MTDQSAPTKVQGDGDASERLPAPWAKGRPDRIERLKCRIDEGCTLSCGGRVVESPVVSTRDSMSKDKCTQTEALCLREGSREWVV